MYYGNMMVKTYSKRDCPLRNKSKRKGYNRTIPLPSRILAKVLGYRPCMCCVLVTENEIKEKRRWV